MDYSNLSIGQTGNNFINNSNDIAPASQNNTFEFYLPLPNDTRIYHVIYTELNSTEIARLLNNRIDLSHIPNHRLPYHYNVQHIIRQQITIPQQSFDTMDVQPIYQEYSACDVSLILPIQQPVDYQQDAIPQQSFQEYSDNSAYDISPFQQPINYQQDTIPQQSFDTVDIQPTIQDNNTNDTSSVPNSPEDGYNSITSK
ncbi:hypothetical protein RhiirC2_815941 [Rhizophagus irregularis]|uniref:Uncharacterized protein n=1 Tax=Rhizophagus irregularis TaxID=588596 RepID=A0A2N1MJQ5_9GLOM|nr:hypothetical protein RhiirC2_815941 [Rhizophagus irregularis]